MSRDSLIPLDYAVPKRRFFDLPIAIATTIQFVFLTLVLTSGHRDSDGLAAGCYIASTVLLGIGVFNLSMRTRLYVVAVVLIAVETVVDSCQDRYRDIDGMTADGLLNFFLLHPPIVVLMFRLRSVDRPMLFLAITQLLLVPMLFQRFPAFLGWVRYGPDSARWVYLVAWLAFGGIIAGTVTGIVLSLRAPDRSHPWLGAILLLSGTFVFLSRMWLDQILRRSGIWITPSWEHTYPVPDRDPLPFRAYFLAGASPLTILLIGRLIFPRRRQAPIGRHVQLC